MKILLIQDEGVNIDLEKSTTLLNDLCGAIKCESYNIPICLDSESTFIKVDRDFKDLKDWVGIVVGGFQRRAGRSLRMRLREL